MNREKPAGAEEIKKNKALFEGFQADLDIATAKDVRSLEAAVKKQHEIDEKLAVLDEVDELTRKSIEKDFPSKKEIN